MKSGNLKFLEPSGPLQACNGAALPFFVLKLINFRKPYERGYFKRHPKLKHLVLYLALFLSCNGTTREIEQTCTSPSLQFYFWRWVGIAMDRTPCTVICMRCLFGNKELWSSYNFKTILSDENRSLNEDEIFSRLNCVLNKSSSLVINFFTTLEGTYSVQRLAR
jgi:hypothetical protein